MRAAFKACIQPYSQPASHGRLYVLPDVPRQADSALIPGGVHHHASLRYPRKKADWMGLTMTAKDGGARKSNAIEYAFKQFTADNCLWVSCMLERWVRTPMGYTPIFKS